MKKPLILGLMIPVLLAALLTAPAAYAKRKHAKADNDVCFNKALNPADKDACLSGFRAANTVADRAKLNKIYKQKVRVASQAH